MWSLPFNNACESYWKSGSMELFLVAIAHPFFTNKQRHKFWMKREPATLSKYSGDVKVFVLPVNGVNYLSGFKLHLSAEMRRLCEGMKWLRVCWGGASPPGLALINWGLVRFVGLSVLKWASVSSSPSPGALRGYLVVIPPHFPGSSLASPFIPKEMTWKGSVCCLRLC